MANLINNRIAIDPGVRFGKPCIKGTRIAVEDVLNLLRAGWTINEISQEYPEITKKDILAALDFAAKLSREPARVFSFK